MAAFTEQFEDTSLHELVANKPFKSAKGLTLTLLTSPIDFQAKASEIRAWPLPDRAHNREFVVGDNSIVLIDFGRMVKDLTLDYTEEDKYQEYGEAPDIDVNNIPVEKAIIARFSFIGNGKSTDHDISGIKNSQVFSQHSGPFEKLEIITSRIGEVHFDALMWSNA